MYTKVDAFNSPYDETQRALAKNLSGPPDVFDECGFYKPRRKQVKYEKSDCGYDDIPEPWCDSSKTVEYET